MAMNKKRLMVSSVTLTLILSGLLLTVQILSVQAQQQEWSFSTGHNPYISFWGLIQTTDGGFLLGSSAPNGVNMDPMLVKINSTGGIQWKGTYPLVSLQTPNVWYARSVVPTQNGDGYVFLTGSRGILVKTDTLGREIWNRTIVEVPEDVIQTSDGGYLVTGYPYTTKTDSEGNVEWQRFGNVSAGAIENNDGSFILAGGDARGGVAMLFKLDKLGNLLWNQTYGFPTASYFNRITKTSDGGYLLGGVAAGNWVIVKTDDEGNLQWKDTNHSGILSFGPTLGNARLAILNSLSISEIYENGTIIQIGQLASDVSFNSAIFTSDGGFAGAGLAAGDGPAFIKYGPITSSTPEPSASPTQMPRPTQSLAPTPALSPTPKPSTQPSSTPSGFLGTSLPNEYGYAIVAVSMVMIVAGLTLVYFKKIKKQKVNG